MRYEKGTYTHSTVDLDGNEYVGCTFTSCIFVYRGGAIFSLKNNTITADCRFVFDGAAGNTVLAMKFIYSLGDWGRNHILATFETIAPDLKKLN